MGGATFSRGCGEHQRPAGRPLHLEDVGVAHLERQQRLALLQRVEVGQAVGPRTHKQVPGNGTGQRSASTAAPHQLRMWAEL